MASQSLINAIQSYDNYINTKGIDEQAINAYVLAVSAAIEEERDINYGLDISRRVKELINSFVAIQTGGDIYALERFAQDNKTMYEILEKYYEVLKFEARYQVKSFFEYLEIDTEQAKRFYYPRKKTLASILDAYQEVVDGKLDFLSVSQPKRTGKAVEASTMVWTPSGTCQIKDLKEGDYVIGANGLPTKVLGVYPQEEKKQIYEVTFSETGKSKQKTVIECCSEHLWEVSTEDSRYKQKPNRVMTTAELFSGTIKRGHDEHNNYAVDYIKPVEFTETPVTVDPWLLGFLIGDGCFMDGAFFTIEDDILEKATQKCSQYSNVVKHAERCTYKYSHGELRTLIQGLGLSKARSYEKFIPKEYLFNSVEVRTQLLQGLCDSDGYCESGGIEYCTASERLAKDIMFLVKSLGGKVSCSLEDAHYTKGEERVECRKKYRLYMNFPKNGVCPVSSKKHLKKYNPQRGQLYHFIENIKKTDRFADMVCIEVEDDRALYAISENFILTHNTTSGLRLSMMMGGQNPDGSIFATGKGEGLVKSFFGGINETFEDEHAYKRYLDVFPRAVKVGQNADELTIHLGKKRRFATFTCRPIDGSIVGNTEANVLLYIDDCVKNHEEARNRDRLEFLCEKVTDDVLGRRIEGTPIIIQGTKYSLYDPISFLQKKADEIGWRWREVAIPALDPVTDESNWEIEKDGKRIFTTAYYRAERNLVTEETWAAEFQQEPFEAKGRLFPADKLNYYERLPVDVEPDTIIAACDTADKGTDSCSMPIAYVYGNDVYIEDVVFDNSGPEHTKPECANKIIQHSVKAVTFEANGAGQYFGRDVMALVEKGGGRCSAKYKFNTTNKITRMENAADVIMKYYHFKDKSCYAKNSPYDKFMREVTTITRSGKISHDDAPDSLALLENEMRSKPKQSKIMHGIL